MIYEIDMKLPSLNDYIRICRGNKYQAAAYKAKLEREISYFLVKMPKYDKPVKIHFHWVEGNKRRNYDNICFAKKFILDSMVKYGHMTDDNRKHVTAFTDTFEYGEKTKVMLIVEVAE